MTAAERSGGIAQIVYWSPTELSRRLDGILFTSIAIGSLVFFGETIGDVVTTPHAVMTVGLVMNMCVITLCNTRKISKLIPPRLVPPVQIPAPVP